MPREVIVQNGKVLTRVPLPPLQSHEKDLFLVTGIRRFGEPAAIDIEPFLEIDTTGVYLGTIRVAPNVLHFRFVEPPLPRTVTVAAFDEPVEVIKWLVPVDAGTKIRTYSLEGQTPRLVPRRTELTDELFDVRAYYTALGKVPTRSTRQLKNAREFFADFEKSTHPKLIPLLLTDSTEATLRCRVIREIMIDLRFRFAERKDKALAKMPDSALKNLAHNVSENHREYLKYIAKLQTELIVRYFQKSDGSFDAKTFERAFELFANGDLRWQSPSLGWVCQPSSGFFFFFGEFAILANDNSVDQAFWGSVANVMVRTQQVFVRTYGPPTPPAMPTYADYNAGNYSTTSKMTAAEIAVIRKNFTTVSKAQLPVSVAKHAEMYLPGVT